MNNLAKTYYNIMTNFSNEETADFSNIKTIPLDSDIYEESLAFKKVYLPEDLDIKVGQKLILREDLDFDKQSNKTNERETKILVKSVNNKDKTKLVLFDIIK